jgi:hypothetical protein
MNKLEPIAKLIKQVLENRFGIEAKYSFEHKKDWLLNVPSKELYNEFWNEISFVYSKVVDNNWDINYQINLIPYKKLTAKPRIDIWFDEPYNFICEFDETQHFNQYRKITLVNSYKDFKYSFDYDEYINICEKRVLEPGTSGFHKLRTLDYLFPPIYEGEKQDNRLRQRAFRDFLKDIVPVKLGYNPTVRISNKVTNGKIKDFTSSDLDAVRAYLYDIDILEKIKMS